MKLPLEDGQVFTDKQDRTHKVAGEIKEPGTESVCYTRAGCWFRRKDGVEVTGAYRDDNGNPVTVQEAYRLRRRNRYNEDIVQYKR